MALKVGELFASLRVDTDDFDSGIDSSSSALSKLGGMADSIFSNIGAMASKAALGVSGMSAAVAAAAPAVGAVGGLAASFASAGIGAVAFGAVATSALGNVFEKSEEIAKIEEKIANADSAKERAAAQEELAKAMAGVSEQQKFAMTELSNFKSFWGDFVKQFEEPIFNTFGTGLHFMQELLNGLAPTIGNVASTLQSFVETLDQDISNGGFAKFFDWLEVNAAESLRSFLIIGSNLMEGFFNILMAFAPVGASVEEGLMGMTEKFASWSASLASSNGFQTFVDYIKTNGPVLMSIVGNVFSFLGSAISILAPLGTIVLQALSMATGAISTFFSAVSEKLGGAGAIFETFKGMLITGWQTAWGVIGPLVGFIGQKVMEVFGAIKAWWDSNGSALLENVMIVFQGIWGVIQFIMPAIMAIVGSVFNNIKGVIIGALNIISGVFKIFAGLFTGDWSKMWDGVKQLLSGALGLIWNLWNLLLVGKLIGGLKALGSKLISGFKGTWDNVVSGVSSFGSKVGSLVSSLVQSVVGFFKGLWNNTKSIFDTLRAFGASVWSALSQAIRSTVSGLVSNVKSGIQGMVSSIKDRFNDALSSAKSIFDKVKSAITKPIETAKGTVLGIIDTIKGAFANMKITIPKPKLPKVSVSMGKNSLGIPVPNFDVDWFKTGGIATGPAIAGIGEAGSEAIIPLSGRRMKPFATEIASQIAGAVGGLGGSNAQGAPIVVELSIDGRKFAKATTKYVEEEQARVNRQNQRAGGYNI